MLMVASVHVCGMSRVGLDVAPRYHIAYLHLSTRAAFAAESQLTWNGLL